jgi:hypothetical protein
MNFLQNNLIKVSILLALGACGEFKGPEGDQGKSGVAGMAGANGKNGVNGINGKDGVNGRNGEKGEKGDSGATIIVPAAEATVELATYGQWLHPVTRNMYYVGRTLDASSAIPDTTVFCADGARVPTAEEYEDFVLAGGWVALHAFFSSVTRFIIGLGDASGGGYQVLTGDSSGMVISEFRTTAILCMVEKD